MKTEKMINWKLVKESKKGMIILFAVGFFAIAGLHQFLTAIWNLLF